MNKQKINYFIYEINSSFTSLSSKKYNRIRAFFTLYSILFNFGVKNRVGLELYEFDTLKIHTNVSSSSNIKAVCYSASIFQFSVICLFIYNWCPVHPKQI